MRRLTTFLLAAAAVVAAVRFLKTNRGTMQHAADTVTGAASTPTPTPTPARTPTQVEGPDDVTLARKVETEIFRAPDAPKADVSVDVQGGIVHLRGEVADDESADRLAAEARNVDGIRGVENLLHEPGTPAPDAPPRGLVQERTD
jgi:osmotically-inducible protein OsmY